MTPFANEPLANFRREENAAAMRAAIEKVRRGLGREYDLVIGNRRSRTSDKIQSTNPAHPDEVIGIHQKAGLEHVEPTMQAALAAFESWKNVAPEERAALIFRVADILRRRKFEFNAWMILEVGKNWDEAEADTCEAIDFCDLYARSALDMAQAEPLVQLPGERDLLRYVALGVGAVISPWNFPLA
ncbi:MAG: aldehyde dehydrogenase family protein, partial [Bryobacteraceae bacterium]